MLAADRPARRRAARRAAEDERARCTAAERAAADRSWAFGHVIVDEAQELSPMAWRLLMRRCPSRSMTVVGDVAQTGDLAGTAVLGAASSSPYVAQPLAAGRADRQLPHAGRDHGGGRRACSPRSTRRCSRPARSATTGVAPWAPRRRPAALAGTSWSPTVRAGGGRRSATAGSACSCRPAASTSWAAR